MKKTYIIGILLALLVLAGGAGAFVLTGSAVDRAERAHEAVYSQYARMQANARTTALTVTEDGIVIGDYTLEDLGVLANVSAAVDQCFAETDRMEPALFANLPIDEKLEWSKTAQSGSHSVPVDLTGLNLSVVLEDLEAMPRYESENAYVEFIDGEFFVHEEINGNMLQIEEVQAALTKPLMNLIVDDSVAAQVRVELTNSDCYILPELTVANTFFDFEAMLRDSVKSMTVTVNFHNGTETLDAAQLEKLLKVDKKGQITADRDALWQIILGWAETYKETKVPYLLDTYVDGLKPIEIVKVDYDVHGEDLLNALMEQMVELKSFELDCPYYCWRNGNAFELKDNYVEVDISNQTMTYFKDGEVLVTTPIVSGATWGYPTPEGLYKVENKDTNCWLSGADYNVHVDYWIGVIGWQIGIHDADWRTIFGGQQYIREGSHGCINTPKEAVIPIFENIEVGVPVLIHGK